MSQGFSPYSGDSFGSPGGNFSGPNPEPPHRPVTGATAFKPTSSSGSAGSFRAASAPVHCLIPSLVLGLIGVVLNAVITFGSATATDSIFAILAGLGWALAGIAGVTLLAWYFNTDNKRRGSGFYTEIGWKKAVYYATMAVLVIAVVWSAVDIALWVGKL